MQELTQELEQLQKNMEALETAFKRVESKLWWIQGILGSAAVALVMLVIRILMVLK